MQRLCGLEKKLAVEAHEGRWLIDGRHDPALDGCIDIDLGISPSTNTLPLNRTPLAVGEVRSFTMAWVKFPDLALSPLRQSYERLDNHRYRFRSLDSDFTALLTVDPHGIVETYENYWQRRGAATS